MSTHNTPSSDARRSLPGRATPSADAPHATHPVRLPALPIESAWTSREILEAMLASAPIAIVTADTKGTILYANAKLLEMFGYSYEELEGQTIELLIPDRFRRDHVAHRENFSRNPHVRSMGSGMDLAGRRKDGSEFPIEAGLSYVHVGDELIIMGSITDITRRKHTEEVLEQRVEERTRELERRQKVSDGLREILAVLNSNYSLDDILNHIVGHACHLLHADASAIFRVNDTTGQLMIQASAQLDSDGSKDAQETIRRSLAAKLDAVMGGDPTAHAAVSTIANGKHTVVLHSGDEMEITTIESSDYKPGADLGADADLANASGYQALLTVPLTVKGETYGNLILYYRAMRRFSAEEIELAMMVGDQTALAIENARLRTQVERTAVAAERSRIARDLHDSVTQTLFSASLIAEVLPRLLPRNPAETERRLDELRQLTRGALAEMRTLLLELRPATLIEVNFRELLRQLIEAIIGRARVPISLEIEGETLLPPDVKIAFYHIAQEALNNVAKHARASQVTVVLYTSPHRFHITVTDDGRGFVIDSVTPEHLGLTIMHERAEAIGARLRIHSELNVGTEVYVEWNQPEE